jgi:hypothetical protein
MYKAIKYIEEYRERATTISKESTPQANGGGSGGPVEIQ